MFLTTSNKSPFYQLVYKVNGKRTTVSTRTTNINEAKVFLSNFKPDTVKQELKPQSISIQDFKEEYLSFILPSKSKHYIRSVKLSLKHFIMFAGNIEITKINNRLIDSFINHNFSRSKHAAALYYRTLKAAFTKAVDWDYLLSNPFTKVKLPKIPKSHPVFISKTEFQQIIDHTDKKYLKNIFITAFYTGMRLGEIVNMKWNWIDLEQNLITVKCSQDFTTKSKKERIIPINQTLRQVLVNHFPKVININQNDFVFTKCTGIKFNEDFVSKQFKKSVRAAKLNDKIHFHTLRHSFASNLVQKNVSLYIVKELLGHEDIKTTQIYSHLQKDNLYTAISLL